MQLDSLVEQESSWLSIAFRATEKLIIYRQTYAQNSTVRGRGPLGPIQRQW